MNPSTKDIIVLSNHLEAYNSILKNQETNIDIIRSVVTNLLNSGKDSFLTSMPLNGVKALLLLGFNDLNDKIIQAIPKVRIRGFARSLKNTEIAQVLYSLADVNDRKFLISYLNDTKSNRWNYILQNDASLSKDYNTELSDIKKNLETLQKIKTTITNEIDDLKETTGKIKKQNTELSSMFSDHEKTIRLLEDKIADAEITFRKGETKRQAINKAMNEREESLSKREQEISKENQRLLKQKVEQSLPGYIRKTQALLKAKERHFSKAGKNWSYIGIACVIISIYCGIFFTIYSIDFINSNDKQEWKYLVINTFKGGLVVGVFLYIAQHAFNISNAYVHESIQRSDKRHAINFGELFLKIYGSSLQRDELLKVFENWNITTDSAFKKIQKASLQKDAFSLLNSMKPTLSEKEKKPDIS